MSFVYKLGCRSYRLDLGAMTQQSCSSQVTRAIRRIFIAPAHGYRPRAASPSGSGGVTVAAVDASGAGASGAGDAGVPGTATSASFPAAPPQPLPVAAPVAWRLSAAAVREWAVAVASIRQGVQGRTSYKYVFYKGLCIKRLESR